MSDNNRVSTNKAPKALGLYPHARKVGNLLFLSGVGPRVAGSDSTDSEVPGLKLDKNGNYIEFDFESQCKSVFENERCTGGEAQRVRERRNRTKRADG